MARSKEHARPASVQAFEPPPPPREWSEKEKALVEWFGDLKTVPPGPFTLRPACRVEDPGRFVAALRKDVAEGPCGARARLGALVQDLEAMKQVVDAAI